MSQSYGSLRNFPPLPCFVQSTRFYDLSPKKGGQRKLVIDKLEPMQQARKDCSIPRHSGQSRLTDSILPPNSPACTSRYFPFSFPSLAVIASSPSAMSLVTTHSVQSFAPTNVSITPALPTSISAQVSYSRVFTLSRTTRFQRLGQPCTGMSSRIFRS